MVKWEIGGIVAVIFQEQLAAFGIVLNETQMQQFETYYQFLVMENQVMNLTAITDREEVYSKHFLDSLSLVKALAFSNQTILDVGSGAGFPSIPLKIVFPNIKITIVDSLQKRIDFLTRLLHALAIDGVELIHGRAEEYSEKGKFDVVTARAVAKMNLLSELCLPFVKVGGQFIAMKSIHCEAELEEAKNAIQLLGGKLDNTITYIPYPELSRVLVVIQKVKSTPAMYPRSFAQIKKRPL